MEGKSLVLVACNFVDHTDCICRRNRFLQHHEKYVIAYFFLTLVYQIS